MRELEIALEWEKEQRIAYLVLKEAIQFSQRVEQFAISCIREEGTEETVYEGTVIGHKKIVPLGDIKTRKLKVRITDARVAPILSFIGAYGK